MRATGGSKSWTVATAVAVALATTSPAAAEDARLVAARLTDEVARALPGIQDSTCLLHQQEYKGRMRPKGKAFNKANKRGDVYMKFLDGPNKGREILYRPGKNNDKMLVTVGFVNMSLNPDGMIARRGQRHTIRDAGIIPTAKKIGRDQKKLVDNPALEQHARYEDLGVKVVHGEKAHCYVAHLPKDKDKSFYAYKSEICVNLKTKMPASVRIWDHEDGKIRLVESYSYEGCKYNTLTDADFDEDNPDYGF